MLNSKRLMSNKKIRQDNSNAVPANVRAPCHIVAALVNLDLQTPKEAFAHSGDHKDRFSKHLCC